MHRPPPLYRVRLAACVGMESERESHALTFSALSSNLRSAADGAAAVGRGTFCAVIRAHLLTLDDALAASPDLAKHVGRVFDVLGPSSSGKVGVFELRCALITLAALEADQAAQALFDAASIHEHWSGTIEQGGAPRAALEHGFAAIILTGLVVDFPSLNPAEQRGSIDATAAIDTVFDACEAAGNSCASSLYRRWDRMSVSAEQFADPSCGFKAQLIALLPSVQQSTSEPLQSTPPISSTYNDAARSPILRAPAGPRGINAREAAVIDNELFRREGSMRASTLSQTLAQISIEQLCDVAQARATVKRTAFVRAVLDCTEMTPGDAVRSGMSNLVGKAYEAFAQNGAPLRLSDAIVGMSVFTIGRCDAAAERGSSPLAEAVRHIFVGSERKTALGLDELASFFVNVLTMGRATGCVPAHVLPSSRALGDVAQHLARTCVAEEDGAEACGGVSQQHFRAWLTRISSSTWIALPPSAPNHISGGGDARTLSDALQRCGFDTLRRVLSHTPSLSREQLGEVFANLLQQAVNAPDVLNLTSYFLETCDSNADDAIDLRELVTGITRLSMQSADIIEIRRACRSLFNIYDASGDGLLESSEVEELLINTIENDVYVQIGPEGAGRNIALYEKARAEASELVVSMMSSDKRRDLRVLDAHHAMVDYGQFEEWFMTRANGGGKDWRFQLGKVLAARLVPIVGCCFTVADIEALPAKALCYISNETRESFTAEVLAAMLALEAPHLKPAQAAKLDVKHVSLYTPAALARVPSDAWASLAPSVRASAESAIARSAEWAASLNVHNACNVTESELKSASHSSLSELAFSVIAAMPVAVRTVLVSRCLSESKLVGTGALGSHAFSLDEQVFKDHMEDVAVRFLTPDIVAGLDVDTISTLPRYVRKVIDADTAAACALGAETFDALTRAERTAVRALYGPKVAMVEKLRANFAKMDWTCAGALTMEALRNPMADHMLREIIASQKMAEGEISSVHISMVPHPAGFPDLFERATGPPNVVVAHAYEVAVVSAFEEWQARCVVASISPFSHPLFSLSLSFSLLSCLAAFHLSIAKATLSSRRATRSRLWRTSLPFVASAHRRMVKYATGLRR